MMLVLRVDGQKQRKQPTPPPEDNSGTTLIQIDRSFISRSIQAVNGQQLVSTSIYYYTE